MGAADKGSIVFHLLPEAGHVRPTLHLASRLRKLGYDVTYFCEPDASSLTGDLDVEHVAFDVPILDVPGLAKLTREEAMAVFRAHEERRWHAYSRGKCEEQLRALDPVLIVGDHCLPHISLVAAKMNVPYIRCSTALPAEFEHAVPPPWSDALPGELSPSEQELEIQTESCFYRMKWSQNPATPSRHEFFRWVSECGLDHTQINERCTFSAYTLDSAPELVMCARAFDFQRAQKDRRVYAGSCLGELAEEGAEPDESSCPLVVFSLGSQTAKHRRVQRSMVENLVDIASRHSEWRFLLAIPDEMANEFQFPDNLSSQSWIQQRQVLRTTDVFISHSGLGSVKEALWQGVPILAVPQVYDQHGNAARIEFHGVGKRLIGDQQPQVDLLEDALTQLINDAQYKLACSKMRDAFRKEDAQEEDLALVEDMIAGAVALESPRDYQRRREALMARFLGG